MIPRRRKPQRSGIRAADGPLRCTAHLAWIRGCTCSTPGPDCVLNIEAAHVRRGQGGGMGLKPGDDRTLPLCSAHHAEQHRIGERAFERRYSIDMVEIAEALARASPHLWRLRNG